MKKQLLLAVSAGVITAAMMSASPAQAQQGKAPVQGKASVKETNQADDSDAIIVTARRRREVLQNVPAAISAFNSAQLKQRGVETLVDVAKFTPGLNYNEQGIQAPGRIYTQIRFRGLGTEITEPFGQVGSAFLDGIYVSSGVSSLGTENLERVEVEKGPASAWLGRSTFAGAINMITKSPNLDHVQGSASGSLASYTTYDFNAGIDLPLVKDKLGVRLYGQAFGTGGQYTASDGGSLGRESTVDFSGTLLAKPTDALTLKINATYAHDNDGAPAAVLISGPLGRRGHDIGLTNCLSQHPSWQNLYIRNDPANGHLTDFVCGEVPIALNLVDSNTKITPDMVKFWNDIVPQVPGVPYQNQVGNIRNQLRVSAHLTWDLPFDGFLSGSSLSLLGGYGYEAVATIRDFDFTQYNNWFARSPQKNKVWQAGMRITSDSQKRFTWMLGLSYFNATFISDYAAGEPIIGADGGITIPSIFSFLSLNTTLGLPFDGKCPCILPPFTVPPENFARTLGVYGSLGFKFTDTLSAQFDWRYQTDRIRAQSITIQNVSPLFAPYVVSDGGGNGLLLGDSFNSFLPRFTLQYQPTPQTNMWITYSKGNNPGFFNGSLLSNTETENQAILQKYPSAQLFVKEETLDNYEIGLRQQLFNNRLNFSLVAYYMLWKNQKARTQIEFTNPENGSQGIANLVVGGFDTDFHGVEFQGTAHVDPRLTLDLSVDWAQAKFKHFLCGFTNNYAPAQPDGTLDCTGNRPVMYPEWSGAFGATWIDSLTNNLDYMIRIDTDYTGKRYVDEKNFAYIGPSAIVNLRFGVQNARYKIQGFVTNLFQNDQYLAGARWSDFSADQGSLFPFEFGLQQAIVLTPPQKREFGMRVSINF